MAYNYNVLHIANIRMDDMGYADMIRNGGVTDEAYNTYVRGEVYRIE